MIKNIYNDNPFPAILGSIWDFKITMLTNSNSVSREVFILENSYNKYKLRCCSSINKAETIEKNLSLLPDFFPYFYGRDSQYLLFDFIRGNHIAYELSHRDSIEIGRLVASFHQLNIVNSKSNPNKHFQKYIEFFNKKFSDSFIEKLNARYKYFSNIIEFDLVLEFNDIHSSNILRKSSGKLIIVDEDAIGFKPKGLGIAKALYTTQWIKNLDQQSAFYSGYSEYYNLDYLTKDYIEFITFLQLLRTIKTKIEIRKSYSSELDHLYTDFLR